MPNMAGNKYFNIDPKIQITSIKLVIRANPSPRVDINVAPRLPNSSCPDSLRLVLLRFLIHTWSQITTGIRSNEINKLNVGSSITNLPF